MAQSKYDFLNGYLNAMNEELSLMDELNTLRLSMLPSGIAYDGVGGGGSVPHGLEAIFAKYDDMERDLLAQIEKRWAVRQMIVGAINALPDALERSVLTWHYINLCPQETNGHITGYRKRRFEEIAASLDYTYDYVRHQHVDGVKHLVIPTQKSQ